MRRSVCTGLSVGIILSFLGAIGFGASGAHAADSGWKALKDMPPAVANGPSWVRPKFFGAFQLNRAQMRAVLNAAPMEETPDALKPLIISIPMPDGTLMDFKTIESPIMPPVLQAQYKDIRTYSVVGVKNHGYGGRIDMTPSGFHAAIFTPNSDTIYVDPYTAGNWDYYASYYTKSHERAINPFRCLTPGLDAGPFRPRDATSRNGEELRTYRFACSANGEYTGFHSAAAGRAPNVADGLAAVVTAVNRVNTIYIRDAAIRLNLVAQNNLLIYTNPATDPYTNPADLTLCNNQNQGAINTAIGSDNYDFGHLLEGGGDFGGLAGGIGTACIESLKGKGTTSAMSPVGDSFVVSIMCHELGHQFGAYHTMNRCNGGQSGNGASEYEVGSGTTIMSYNGICQPAENIPAENTNGSADPMFNAGSLASIVAYIRNGDGSVCPSRSNIGNTPPSVNAGSTYTIPVQTPFKLTASATDPDNDPITYSWEEFDLGFPQVPGTDNGTSPIERVWLPTTSPSRTIPRITAAYLATPSVIGVGEMLPLRPRAMKWRVVARDNHPNCGGLAWSDVTINVTNTSGPFRVTGPSTGLLQGLIQVTWDVAGTDTPPVSCENVRIRISNDNGLTFPDTAVIQGRTTNMILADSVPNSGTAIVTLPAVLANVPNCRIKVEAVDNIFFDISHGPITVVPPTPGVTFVATGTIGIDDRFGNGNNNQRVDPGEKTVGVSIEIRNNRGTTATNVIGTLTSTTPGITIVRGTVPYPDAPFATSIMPVMPFVIKAAPTATCGSTIALRLVLNYTPTASTTLNTTIPLGLPAGPGDPLEFSFNSWDAPVAIPDNDTTGIKVRVDVTGVNAIGLGVIGDIDFRFNSRANSDCAVDGALLNSATPGLLHSYVGDLVMSIAGPDGTVGVLMNRPGTPPPLDNFCSGNNFCNTTLNDTPATLPSIQTIAAAQNPYSRAYRPFAPLSIFNGHPADGIWALDIQDRQAGDVGNVRSFTLVIRPQMPARCFAPGVPLCRGDVDDGSGMGIPDGGVTIEDLLFFLSVYEAGDIRADLDDGSGTGTTDGGVTIEDLLYMVARFQAGC